LISCKKQQKNGAPLETCIFCKIAAKKIPSDLVYEDEQICVFKDIRPAAPVHLLLIPREHISTLSSCDAGHVELLGKMLALVPKLATEHGCGLTVDESGHQSGGYKTVINTGPDGGQEVPHFHIHLLGGPHPWRGRL
jgi:histidine triad (HIT) family protein